jgi:hypothetical protein
MQEKQTPWNTPIDEIPKPKTKTPKSKAQPKVGKPPSGQKKAGPITQKVNRVKIDDRIGNSDSGSDRPNDRTGSSRPNI